MLTEAQKKIVKDQFARLAGRSIRIGQSFYTRLFEQYPGVRPLFSDNMSAQYAKFMGMLSLAVDALDNPAPLLPLLVKMGENHVGYGVQDAHWEPVRIVFLETLAEHLGNEFNEESRQAWTAVLLLLENIMKESAAMH
jgi:hemoglobin-like flavoprotein